jgi:threonine-phosphate decarboxylase
VTSETDPPIPVQDHGGNTREVCSRLGLERVLDFSASINPLGQPEGLREYLSSHWEEVAAYPDRHCGAFLSAVAAQHGVPRTGLVAGNGSAELIDLLLRAYSPRRLVLAPPDFGLYREVAPEGLEVVEAPRLGALGYAPDLSGLADLLRPGDLVLLSNPGNPSGQYTDPMEFGPLLAACARREAHLALDEAFVDFQPGPTCLPLVAGDSHLSVFRSLTKFYGIPGLRLGLLAASPELVGAVRRLQVPWSVNALAQLAGRYCMADAEWATRSVRAVAKLRSQLAVGLGAIPGIRPLDSSANYLLLQLQTPAPTATRLYSDLAHRGILVRHCGSFGLGEHFLRVAVRTTEENRRLISTLAELANDW